MFNALLIGAVALLNLFTPIASPPGAPIASTFALHGYSPDTKSILASPNLTQDEEGGFAVFISITPAVTGVCEAFQQVLVDGKPKYAVIGAAEVEKGAPAIFRPSFLSQSELDADNVKSDGITFALLCAETGKTPIVSTFYHIAPPSKLSLV